MTYNERRFMLQRTLSDIKFYNDDNFNKSSNSHVVHVLPETILGYCELENSLIGMRFVFAKEIERLEYERIIGIADLLRPSDTKRFEWPRKSTKGRLVVVLAVCRIDSNSIFLISIDLEPSVIPRHTI